MKKYRWLFVILGVVVLGVTLVFGAAFGAGITYYFLQTEPVQASVGAPVDVENDAGVLISNVKPESSAAEAGLVRGDIILEINEEPVNNMIEMKRALSELEPGEIVQLTVLHGDETRILEAELDDADGFAFLGVGTCDLSKNSKVFPGGPKGDVFIEAFSVGAEIVEIVPESPAEAAGLQVGDVILRVNQKPIGLKANLADLIQKHEPGEVVILEVLSGADEESLEIELTLGENPDNPGKAYLGVAYQMNAPMGFESGEFPFLEVPKGFEGEEGMPHFYFHHGEEFEGELPEGWEEGGDFFFHGEEGMPHFFDLGELPEGIEGAVIISEVLEDTPAEGAGLQPGDLIVAIDGEPIEEIEVFVKEMQSRKPGDEVTLTIIREDEEIEFQVTLTAHPDDPEKGFLGVLAGTFISMEEMELPEGFNQDFEFELPGVPGDDA